MNKKMKVKIYSKVLSVFAYCLILHIITIVEPDFYLKFALNNTAIPFIFAQFLILSIWLSIKLKNIEESLFTNRKNASKFMDILTIQLLVFGTIIFLIATFFTSHISLLDVIMEPYMLQVRISATLIIGMFFFIRKKFFDIKGWITFIILLSIIFSSQVTELLFLGIYFFLSNLGDKIIKKLPSKSVEKIRISPAVIIGILSIIQIIFVPFQTITLGVFVFFQIVLFVLIAIDILKFNVVY